eukprot:3069947-Amphidinium_carterae.1
MASKAATVGESLSGCLCQLSLMLQQVGGHQCWRIPDGVCCACTRKSSRKHTCSRASSAASTRMSNWPHLKSDTKQVSRTLNAQHENLIMLKCLSQLFRPWTAPPDKQHRLSLPFE